MIAGPSVQDGSATSADAHLERMGERLTMNDLLQRAIAAHGGLDRFNQFRTVSVDISIGGALWLLKVRQEQSNVRVTVDLHQERTVFAPFELPNQHSVFTPQRLTVETNQG